MTNRRTAIITISLLSCLLIAAGVLANGTAGLDWWVFGSGGGPSSGGSISLEAGFQPGAGEVTYDVYLPQVLR